VRGECSLMARLASAGFLAASGELSPKPDAGNVIPAHILQVFPGTCIALTPL
jgi:hypothetical protein